MKDRDILDKFLDTSLIIGAVGLAFCLGMKFAKKRGVR